MGRDRLSPSLSRSLRPRLIIINLLMVPGYFDIALRDVGLSLAALALGRLSAEFSS